ncbi:MAG: biopolymer transporter ExbD [Bdellovibrionaceae bacterium]|nr:biopolymer transporter ExbD [Pseudobdellovibrionaceae bacterium]
MRNVKTRSTDATFDLNLAPILDIIVSIVPLLLLSVAFVQVKMIDTSVPQVVAEAVKRANDKTETTVSLKVSKSKGFTLEVTKDGKTVPTTVPNKNDAWDLEGLHAAAFAAKVSNPEVFRLDMSPENDVNLNELVAIMDKLRRNPETKKTTFKDPESGQSIETELMFPNVLFANVIGN